MNIRIAPDREASISETSCRSPRPLFLAPHYDDVALSCGGTVAATADAGERPLIVTCFGGSPAGPLTGFARWQHERWGLNANEAVAQRRREEQCAAQALGAESHWLDFPDAIYREARYTSDESLFGDLHPDDIGLPEALVVAIEGLLGRLAVGASRVVVPLGVGNHVDHQITLSAGHVLAQGGHDVWAYEDYPYAGDPEAGSALQERALAVGAGELQTYLLSASQLDRRVRAILCYRSQLDVIFRHQGDPAAATRRYAAAAGGGQPAERFWHVGTLAR